MSLGLDEVDELELDELDIEYRDVVMIAGRYTVLEQPSLAELLPLALERGVGYVAASVFNSGLLSRRRPSPDLTYDHGPVPPGLLARKPFAMILDNQVISAPSIDEPILGGAARITGIFTVLPVGIGTG